jgi:exopolysaccharide biosynthesis polyprenyl glycosylphosphotransferase
VAGGHSVAGKTAVKAPSARSSRLRRRGRDAVINRVGGRLPAFEAEISPVWEAIPGQQTRFASRRDTVLRRALAIADGSAAMVAVLLAVVVTDGRISVQPTIVLLFPFAIIAAKAIGLYDRDQHVLRKTTIDEIPSIFYLSVLYALTVWLAETVLFNGYLARPGVFMLVGASFVLFSAGRLLIRGVVTAVAPPERCLVIGNAEDAERITAKLADAGVKTTVTGRMALGGRDGLLRSGATWADADMLRGEIREQLVHRVIIAPDGHDQDEVLHVIRMIKALGVKVTVLPRLLEVVGSSSTYEDVDGMTLLGVRQFGATKSSEALKRSMDIVGAGVTVLALTPLLALLAAAVRLDSRGPVLFRQRRIGRHGELFSMLKFRSMVPNAETIKDELRPHNEVQGGLFKIADDPRITRVGRFLRRTSLDELPQLFNVLGGSMSLVGPRPLVQDEDALIEGWQRRRLAVKPGMTGMWQIFGSSRIPMHEMVKIDYLYGANWSIWLDLKILLRTVPYVLRRRGL